MASERGPVPQREEVAQIDRANGAAGDGIDRSGTETMRQSQRQATSASVWTHPASIRFRLTLCMLGFLLLTLAMSLANPLQAQKRPPPSKRSPAKPGQPTKKGQALFTQSCAPCHGANGQGGEGPALRGLKLTDMLIITTVKNGVKGEMPAFGNKYKDGELKALAAYVLSLKK